MLPSVQQLKKMHDQDHPKVQFLLTVNGIFEKYLGKTVNESAKSILNSEIEDNLGFQNEDNQFNVLNRETPIQETNSEDEPNENCSTNDQDSSIEFDNLDEEMQISISDSDQEFPNAQRLSLEDEQDEISSINSIELTESFNND